jgi:hypothetical protein
MKTLNIAEYEKLEASIKEGLGKLMLWGTTGEWSLVLIGKTFKEYRSDTMQPLLDILYQAMQWASMCGGLDDEWREWRIVKNDIAAMGTVDVPFREVYCLFIAKGGQMDLMPPPQEKKCWELIHKIAADDWELKKGVDASKATLGKTEERSHDVTLFFQTNL